MLRTRGKGQSLVEFALILPVLLMLLLGIIEGGRIIWAYVTVQNAAKNAARYAITGRPTFCPGDPIGNPDPAVYCDNSSSGTPWASEIDDIVRVKAIENVALDEGANLTDNFVRSSLVGISGYNAGKDTPGAFGVLVIGQDLANPSGTPNSGGRPGWNVRVQVYYNIEMVDPIYNAILGGEGILLNGEVEMQNEGIDQANQSNYVGGITYEETNCPPICGSSVSTPYLIVQDEFNDFAEPLGGDFIVAIQDHAPNETYHLWFIDPFNSYTQQQTFTTDSFGSALINIDISFAAPISLPAGTPTYQIYSSLASDVTNDPVAICTSSNNPCFEVFSAAGGVITARNIAPWQQDEPALWPVNSSIPIYLYNHDTNQDYQIKFDGVPATAAPGELFYQGSSVTKIPTDSEFGSNKDGDPGYYIATGYTPGHILNIVSHFGSDVAATSVELTQGTIDIANETPFTTHPEGDIISLVLRGHAPRQDYTVYFADGVTAAAEVTANDAGEIQLYYTVPAGIYAAGNPPLPVEIYSLDRNRGPNPNKIATRTIQVQNPVGPYLNVTGGPIWPAGSPITIQVRQHLPTTTYEVYIQQGPASSPSLSDPVDIPSFTTDSNGRFDIGHILSASYASGGYIIRSFNPVSPTQVVASFPITVTAAPFVSIDDGIRWPPQSQITIRLNNHAANTPYQLWIDPDNTYGQKTLVKDIFGKTTFVTNGSGQAALTYKIPITTAQVSPGYDLHSFLGATVVADNGELEITPADLQITNIDIASQPLEVLTPITLTILNNSPVTITNQFFDTDIYVDPEITPSLASSLPPGEYKNWLNSIGPSQSITVQDSIVLYGLGDHDIYARVDTSDGIVESNELNNLNQTVVSSSYLGSECGQIEEGGHGLVVIDAINAVMNQSGGGDSWVPSTASNVFGESSLDILVVSTDDGDDHSSTVGPHTTYQVNIQSGGNYQFWVAGWGPNTGADTVYGGVNGTSIGTVTGFPTGASAPAWRKMSSSVSLSAGINTVDLWAKEDGFHAYKILLTLNQNFIPPPDGMAQSACSVIVPAPIPPHAQQCFEPIRRGGFEGTFFEVSNEWQSQDLAVVYSVTGFSGNRGAAFPALPNRSPGIRQVITVPTWILANTTAVLTLDKAVSHKNANSPNPNDVLYFTLRRESDGFQLIDPIPLAKGDDLPNLNPLLNPPASWTKFSQDIFAGIDPLSVLQPGDRVEVVIFAPDPVTGSLLQVWRRHGPPVSGKGLVSLAAYTSPVNNRPSFEISGDGNGEVPSLAFTKWFGGYTVRTAAFGQFINNVSSAPPIGGGRSEAYLSQSKDSGIKQPLQTLGQPGFDPTMNNGVDEPSEAFLPASVPLFQAAQTLRDEFDNRVYNGSNGTVDWSTYSWTEISEPTGPGPSNGPVQVSPNSTYCASPNCLRVGGTQPSNPDPGFGVVRQADLGNAATATLTFSYRRGTFGSPTNTTGTLTLDVSDNGGTTWTTLKTYTFDGIDATQINESFDISSLTASNTQIRFLTHGPVDDIVFFIDNIQIEYFTNSPPIVTNPGNQINNETDVVSLPISATDPDGDPLTYSATGLPPGLSINSGTGLISGTLPIGSVGAYVVTVSVDDGTDTTDVGFKWAVTVPPNYPPNVTNPGNQTNDEEDIVSLPIIASDPDGDPLTYGATGLPPGLSINSSTGLISGTIADGSAGTYNVTVSVDDGTDSTAVNFTWTVLNNPPVITDPGNQTNDEGSTVSLPISASDADGDTLTYSATGLPASLAIDPVTGLISGTLDVGSAGIYSATVTVDDGSDTTNLGFTWTVNKNICLNPGVNVQQSSTAAGGVAQRACDGNTDGSFSNGSVSSTRSDPEAWWEADLGSVTALDRIEIWNRTDCCSNRLSDFYLFVSDVPFVSQNLTTTRNQTGVSEYYFASEPSPSVTQVITRTGRFVRVQLVGTNFLSLAEVEIFGNVSNINQPPAISSPGNQTNDEGDTISLTISASDPDGDPLTYSATGLPPNLTINTSTGEITGTVAISSAGTYSVTVTVTDGNFNVDAAFPWTIEVGGPVTGNDTDFFIDNVKLTFCTTQPAPAQLPSLGKLSGKIKLGSTPKSGVTVWAYAYDGGFQAPGPVHTTYSINDGSYNFYNLEPGSYLIYTSMTISGTTYFDGALRSIGPGTDVRNVNLNLQTN